MVFCFQKSFLTNKVICLSHTFSAIYEVLCSLFRTLYLTKYTFTFVLNKHEALLEQQISDDATAAIFCSISKQLFHIDRCILRADHSHCQHHVFPPQQHNIQLHPCPQILNISSEGNTTLMSSDCSATSEGSTPLLREGTTSILREGSSSITREGSISHEGETEGHIVCIGSPEGGIQRAEQKLHIREHSIKSPASDCKFKVEGQTEGAAVEVTEECKKENITACTVAAVKNLLLATKDERGLRGKYTR